MEFFRLMTSHLPAGSLLQGQCRARNGTWDKTERMNEKTFTLKTTST